MAICPNCGRDTFNKRQYTNFNQPVSIKIYWACLSCGLTEQGYWTTQAEIDERQERAALLEDTDPDLD